MKGTHEDVTFPRNRRMEAYREECERKPGSPRFDFQSESTESASGVFQKEHNAWLVWHIKRALHPSILFLWLYSDSYKLLGGWTSNNRHVPARHNSIWHPVLNFVRNATISKQALIAVSRLFFGSRSKMPPEEWTPETQRPRPQRPPSHPTWVYSFQSQCLIFWNLDTQMAFCGTNTPQIWVKPCAASLWMVFSLKTPTILV